jgi:hypothetical protein
VLLCKLAHIAKAAAKLTMALQERRYDSSLSGFPWTEPGWLNGTFNLTTCLSSEEERAKCGEWGDLPLWEVPAYLLPGSFRRTDPAPVDGMSVVEVG